MTTTITIKTEGAHSGFHAMTEGMSEVARDDDRTTDADSFDNLVMATGFRDGMTYPLTFPLTDAGAAAARLVLENLAEDEDEDWASCLLLTEKRAPEFGTLEALEEALAALELVAIDNDTASPEGWRARCAIDTVTALIAQRGCERFDPAVQDGRLTTLCDVIVFG
jgi:hypothetical protein